MSVAPVIQKYLSERKVVYEVGAHPAAYTAQEVAASRHVPGRELAKNVILRADDRLVMGVLPASSVARLDRLRAQLGCQQIRLACEHEFADVFFGCETGAEPPLGAIWDMPVYVDRELVDGAEIEFNAGTHTDTIRMAVDDFEMLTRPTIVDFGVRRDGRRAPQHSAS